MKNQIAQLSILLLAFVALTLLMSYTRPAAEEPKQYILVHERGSGGLPYEELEKQVNQKLAEGWHIQGGVATDQAVLMQAMVK